MLTNEKFNEAKERLITAAQRVAGAYLLSKYGSAHITDAPKVELKAKVGATETDVLFTGSITCYAADGLLQQVGVNMTINNNDIAVESEDIQATVTTALNAAEEQSTATPTVKASLDAFTLTDDGTIYLKVAHTELHETKLGVIGKNEYATSKDRAALLQGIVKDAFLETLVEFTGEFKEPAIEKIAYGCDRCDPAMINGVFCHDAGCSNIKRRNDREDINVEEDINAEEDMRVKTSKKKASLTAKASWLTAELFVEAKSDAACPGCGRMSDDEHEYAGGAYCDDCLAKHYEKNAAKETLISIQENMPRASSADRLKQSAQSEEQSALNAQLKVEHEAANELLSILQGMGYGTAKVIEVTSSADYIDFMTAIDHAGAVKAVNIPVTVNAGKATLPKKALIATLIEKGLNVHAKLAEQFNLDVLEKLAAIDARMAYEAKEANDILSLTADEHEDEIKFEQAVDRLDKKLTEGEMQQEEYDKLYSELVTQMSSLNKKANEGKNTFFSGETDTLTVQKHLLPDHESIKLHDQISDGSDKWELVNMGGQQNSKGEDDSSIWTFKKVQGPADDGKEPKNKIVV